jgi:hypothetical protein
VALPEGELVVNSSQGGGSKDTWVLASAEEYSETSPSPERAGAIPQMRKPDPGPGTSEVVAQQQQQQQSGPAC